MRSLAITNRILTELRRDKRTLALLFVAPLVIMWLLSIMFTATNHPKVPITTNGIPTSVTQKMATVPDVTIQRVTSPARAREAVRHNRAAAAVVASDAHHYRVTYANQDAAKTARVRQALQAGIVAGQVAQLTSGFQKLPAPVQQHLATTRAKQSIQVTNHYQYGTHAISFFTQVLPTFMNFFVFFFVFLISGIGLLKERTSGTLTRLLATPVRRGEVVGGYLLAYGLVAILQTLVIVLATLWLFKLTVVGSLGLIFLINGLLALVALSLGIFISTFASSEFQMVQFIPLVVLPQLFFSGIVPLAGMPTWDQVISRFLPLTYASRAITAVVMRGAGLGTIAGELLALVMFLALFVLLNVLGLRRYRQS